MNWKIFEGKLSWCSRSTVRHLSAGAEEDHDRPQPHDNWCPPEMWNVCFYLREENIWGVFQRTGLTWTYEVKRQIYPFARREGM
jgi:hypothetical protein